MTKLYVYPYTTGSESAKLLAAELGAKRIKLQNSEYVHQEGNLIVNWGNSNCPFTKNTLNQGWAIKNTVDKLAFFRMMMKAGLGGYLPLYWTHAYDIPDDMFPIFCRTTTKGCDGAGIVIANDRDGLVEAELYTRYIPESTEYRVTIFMGEVTDIQTKLPRHGEDAHPMIRTYKNGWGFQRKPVLEAIVQKIEQAAQSAIRASGLDFGGVDVLYDGTKAYVLEVNTAMGLEGDALKRFAAAVQKYALSFEPPAPPAPEPEPYDYMKELDKWVDSVPVSPAGGVDWQTVLVKIAGRLA